MQRNLIGQHLLRVRIKPGIFERMQEIAAYETDRLGAHVTVSDLVRQSCVNAIHTYEAMQQLVLATEEQDADEDGDDVEVDEDDDGKGLPRSLESTQRHPFRVVKLGN
jgi:hypothetical protein